MQGPVAHKSAGRAPLAKRCLETALSGSRTAAPAHHQGASPGSSAGVTAPAGSPTLARLHLRLRARGFCGAARLTSCRAVHLCPTLPPSRPSRFPSLLLRTVGSSSASPTLLASAIPSLVTPPPELSSVFVPRPTTAVNLFQLRVRPAQRHSRPARHGPICRHRGRPDCGCFRWRPDASPDSRGLSASQSAYRLLGEAG